MKTAILSVISLAFGCLLSANPISVNITGTSDLTDPVALTFTANGAGTVIPLGSTSLSINGTFDSTLTNAAGNFDFDFGSGNTLTGTFSVPSIIFLPSGNVGSASGTADILGGTGVYTGYTGAFGVSGSASATGLYTADFTLTGSGNLDAPSSLSSVPEPANFAFVALGALLLSMWHSGKFFSGIRAALPVKA